MPGLILEGGSFRTAFSCGVLDALLDHEIYFPTVIGVSAGACAASSYCSRQKRRGIHCFLDYRTQKAYQSLGNLKKEGSLFGLKYIYETIPNRLNRFDYDAFMNYPGDFYVVATNMESGQAEYLNAKAYDHHNDQFKATCAIPVLFPPIVIEGVPYCDGGVADSIPLAKSMELGNQKNLVVLTQPRDFEKRLDSKTRLSARVEKRKYPKLYEALKTRYLMYNEQRALCFEQEKEGNAILLCPTKALRSNEKSNEALKEAWRDGYRQAEKKMKAIQALFQAE